MSDFLSDLGNGLASIAPTIATMLGGPLAGAGVTALEKAIGVTPAAGDSVDQRKQALATAMATATPEQLIAIKQADAAVQKQLLDAGIQLATVDANDRANARAREMTVRDWLPGGLAVLVTFGFFALLGLMAYVTLPPANAAPLNIMLGALGAAFTSVIAYYFGSSSGSSAKTAVLREALLATPKA